MLDEQATDLSLSAIGTGSVTSWPLSDVDALRVRAHESQDLGCNQSVVEDDVGVAQQLGSP